MHQLTTDLEIHFLELRKWKLKNIKEMNRLEKWLAYFSRTTSPEELEEIAMTEPMIQKALAAEVLFTTDDIMKRKYEKAEKYRRDYAAHMAYATKQGIEQGKAEGNAEGRMETAIELMKEKFPLEKIAKATKLSMEKLQELGRMNGLL